MATIARRADPEWHTYGSLGSYTVTLTVSGPGGARSTHVTVKYKTSC